MLRSCVLIFLSYITQLPGLRSRWMIPWECKHSIARAMSRANATAKRMSKRFGRKLTRYLRNVPPSRSSVTITIMGSLHAPMNYIKSIFKRFLVMTRYTVSQMKRVGEEKGETLTKFLCWTLDNIAISLANRLSLLAISSGDSPLLIILIATVWFLYLNKENAFSINQTLLNLQASAETETLQETDYFRDSEPKGTLIKT